MNNYMELSQLKIQIDASSTPADAMSLIEWSKATMNKIERGDMMIGIMSIDVAQMVPIALRKALDIGVAEAGLCLADWLLRTPIGEPDLLGAEGVILETIALGMDEACVQLMRYRWLYRRHTCTDQDAEQAFKLLEAWCAKNVDNSEAFYLLGLVTCHGFGTGADPVQSAKILDKAVKLGNADAMFELFLYYANGIGVGQDESTAIDFLRRAGEAGQARAMYNLGAFHATGRYVTMDQALAIDWYTRAANAGHFRAAETLATMYENGLGVEPDKALAQRFREIFE
jgi:TPR repeat protein